MGSEPTLCVVCAWRQDCQKKFLRQDQTRACPEFTRDLTTKDPEKHDGETEDRRDHSS